MLVLDSFTLSRLVFDKLNNGLFRVTDPAPAEGTYGVRYFSIDGHVSSAFWEIIKTTAAEVAPPAQALRPSVLTARPRPS